jgi:hypothetical protein
MNYKNNSSESLHMKLRSTILHWEICGCVGHIYVINKVDILWVSRTRILFYFSKWRTVCSSFKKLWLQLKNWLKSRMRVARAMGIGLEHQGKLKERRPFLLIITMHAEWTIKLMPSNSIWKLKTSKYLNLKFFDRRCLNERYFSQELPH